MSATVYRKPVYSDSGSARIFSAYSYFTHQMKFVEIRTGGRTVRFEKEAMVRRHKVEDDYIALEYDQLGLYAVGKTLQEASESFWDDIEFMWRSYAKEADENLTQDARVLKQKLLSCLVEE